MLTRAPLDTVGESKLKKCVTEPPLAVGETATVITARRRRPVLTHDDELQSTDSPDVDPMRKAAEVATREAESPGPPIIVKDVDPDAAELARTTALSDGESKHQTGPLVPTNIATVIEARRLYCEPVPSFTITDEAEAHLVARDALFAAMRALGEDVVANSPSDP
jgi:hypothetical protein